MASTITVGTDVAHEDPDGTKLWCGTVKKIDKNGIATVQYWGRAGVNTVAANTLQRMDSFKDAAIRALGMYFD
jgi:hypothetical protein